MTEPLKVDVNVNGPEEIAMAKALIAAFADGNQDLTKIALGTIADDAMQGRAHEEITSLFVGTAATLAFLAKALAGVAAIRTAQRDGLDAPEPADASEILSACFDLMARPDSPST